MSTPRPVVTVGDLIEQLEGFDRESPVRAQHALADQMDLLITVTDSQTEPGTVVVMYLEPARMVGS